ncbi:hypothetical protein [Gracilimonas amylolytica]|uniref:hypothetical protein n=1 Tax=Gracilimonas amylolytica TaxID=1749045 RepID=UPI000CD99D0F|nr:hypothetical protein [Gracilimonas amylolytica]
MSGNSVVQQNLLLLYRLEPGFTGLENQFTGSTSKPAGEAVIIPCWILDIQPVITGMSEIQKYVLILKSSIHSQQILKSFPAWAGIKGWVKGTKAWQ